MEPLPTSPSPAPPRRGRRSPRARALASLLVLTGLATACRPENKSYSAASILCAEAMRIHLKGDNVPKIQRFNERDEGTRAQILFEMTSLEQTTRQSAASCAFARQDDKRLVLIGASLDGRALDDAEIARLADLLQRGVQ